ncbi:hypothetical protein [Azospirillum sp.]|uniref:hypothetical protein n=1 Tax=Azospirillum sp. TaxID=34012 RepID=UPI003D73EEC7
MSDPHKRFAPPPPHWPGRRPEPAVQAKPAHSPVAQPQATFGALRTGKAERGGAGDELLRLQGNQFVLKTADRGLHVKPNGTYNFVRVQGTTRSDAHTFVSPRSGHAGLAGGKPVLYAGTVRFDSGRIDWWSNYSGTYQPIAAFRQQAQLPDDHFVPWQRLQMGGVGLQRGMFNDRHASAAPAKPERAEPAKPAAPTRATAPAKDESPRTPAAKPSEKTAPKPADKGS